MLRGVDERSDRQGSGGQERYGVPSPGGWTAPVGSMPAWDWTPPGGLKARLERVPRWVRIWYRMPFVDRYAYVWMWARGGWDVDAPAGPATAGVREPLRPLPTSGPGAAEAAEPEVVT